MTTKTQEYKVIRPDIPKTLLEVPHLDTSLTFVYEKHGPDTYANVSNSIEQANIRTPTMAETASLVHTAYMNYEPEFNEIIKELMKNNRLWTFTRSRYFPNPTNGVFVYDEADHEEFKNLSANELERVLGSKEEFGVVFSDDRRLRFTPFGYKIGEMTSLELAKNPYAIALAGEEGAEKLAEIADKHRDRPALRSFEEVDVDEPLTRVSSLHSCRGLSVYAYLIYGETYEDQGGFAFGIQKTE